MQWQHFHCKVPEFFHDNGFKCTYLGFGEKKYNNMLQSGWKTKKGDGKETETKYTLQNMKNTTTDKKT